MNKAQIKAKKKRRAERELIMSQNPLYITRMQLVAEQHMWKHGFS